MERFDIYPPCEILRPYIKQLAISESAIAKEYNPSTPKQYTMFTLEQIAAAHSNVKSGADFPRYVQHLKALGMARYDFMVEDGRAVYFDTTGQSLSGPSKYAKQAVADKSDAAALKQELLEHQQGKSDFPAFCYISRTLGRGKMDYRYPKHGSGVL